MFKPVGPCGHMVRQKQNMQKNINKVGGKVNYFMRVGLGIGKWVNEPFWNVVFCLQLPKILILLKINHK